MDPHEFDDLSCNESDNQSDDNSSAEEEPMWELMGEIAEKMQRYITERATVPSRPRQPRTYVHRERENVARRLVEDYFSDEPRWGATVFRRRFRMSRSLFLRITNTLAARDEYFQQRSDATNREGISTLQKCTVAIRQLAYGGSPDLFDEYLHVAETTGRECLRRFCRGVIEAFRDTYLRKPTVQDAQRLMNMHETRHGFPGMLGSIDCMHWEWKNCPTAWRGAYSSGHKKGSHPTIILEAVADQNLWIWHAFFGVSGSNNDINVLNYSDIFNDVCAGKAPAVTFTANHRLYNMGYYLADGIYPKWPVFVKSIKSPTEPKRALFAQRQEAARKDVERAFGVLQSRWAIVKGPSRMWYQSCIADVMYACIIMHNMIIEDERDDATNFVDENTAATSSSAIARDNPSQGATPLFEEFQKRHASIREERVYGQLQQDLIEEIWARSLDG